MAEGFDTDAWLARLGLSEYAETFRKNAIDLDVLPILTSDDLAELGVAAVGHRRKLLNAAAALRADEAGGAAASAVRAGGPVSTWERRRLTIMFADLVGFTRLSAVQDPEDTRDMLHEFASAVRAAVERFEGQVLKFLGDGVMACFGWPIAHENDAQRAVQAAIAARAATGRLRTPGGDPIALRIGIATGLVVVGGAPEDGGLEVDAVVGDAPNLAARLQALAAPGEIIISEMIWQLTRDAVVAESIGRPKLKGFDTPQPVYRVTGQRDAGLHLREPNRETPLIGRRREVGDLRAQWAAAAAGEARLVVLEGPPGIGKSRVVQTVVRDISASGADCIFCSCSPFFSGSAFHPVLQEVSRAAGFGADDDAEVKRDALRGLFAGASSDAAGAAHAVAAQLGIPGPEGAATLNAKHLRNAAIAALRDLLVARARRRPVALVVEDMHWSDPSTKELIRSCIHHIAGLPVLLLLTTRPPANLGLGPHRPDAHIHLDPMGGAEIEALAAEVAGSESLAAEVLGHIRQRTDGVPFFVVELTKALLESSSVTHRGGRVELAGPLNDDAVPATLSDSLTARLDRLGSRKSIAQIAACLGRDFSVPILGKVSGLPEQTLHAELSALREADFIRDSADGSGTFRFSHALTRDVAHESLLKSERRHIHARVLDALDKDRVPAETLAYHASNAALHDDAADWFTKAGWSALRGSALKEAIGHYANAVRELRTAGTSDAHRQKEIWTKLKMAHAYNGLKGSGANETLQAFTSAMEIADQVDPHDSFFPACYGFIVVSFVRGDLANARAVAEEMIARAAAHSGPVDQMMAHNALATVQGLAGDFRDCETSYGRVLELERQIDSEALIWRYGHDPRGVLRAYRSLAVWCFGDEERAFDIWRQGHAIATDARHPQSLAQPLIFGALLHLLAGRSAESRALIEQALALTTELELRMWRGYAFCLRAWQKCCDGHYDAAENDLRRGAAILDRLEAQYLRPRLSLVEAEIDIGRGDIRSSMAALNRTRDMERATGEKWAAANTLTMLGHAHSAADAALARGYFDRAIALATRQQSGSFRRLAILRAAELPGLDALPPKAS